MGERSGWVTVRLGKGRKQRRVPVNLRAREALAEYFKSRKEDRERKDREKEGREEKDRETEGEEGIGSHAPIFVTRGGQAMTPYAIWYTVKKYAAEAGVEKVSPHTFRHTVATQLVRNPNVDLVTAAAYLGHSRLDTTARYAQPGEEDLEKAAERLA